MRLDGGFDAIGSTRVHRVLTGPDGNRRGIELRDSLDASRNGSARCRRGSQCNGRPSGSRAQRCMQGQRVGQVDVHGRSSAPVGPLRSGQGNTSGPDGRVLEGLFKADNGPVPTVRARAQTASGMVMRSIDALASSRASMESSAAGSRIVRPASRGIASVVPSVPVPESTMRTSGAS